MRRRARRSAQTLDDMRAHATLAMIAVLTAVFSGCANTPHPATGATDPPYCKGLTGVLACVNGTSPAVVERAAGAGRNVSCLASKRVAVLGTISDENLKTLIAFFARQPHRGRVLYALANDQRADLAVTPECDVETAEIVGFRRGVNGWERRAPGELE
jgi:hypothetical protein